MFEIEAIMLTTGYSYDKADEKTQTGIANTVIGAYEKDLPNLLKRSGQTGHDHDGERQRIGYWPSANYLRERVMMGSLTRGKGSIGNNNDSKGSAFLIQLAKEDDDRPVWVGVWGGGNTMCQAVHKLKTDAPGELSAFLKKMRFYTITDQDKGYQGQPLSDSCHGVMRGQTGSDLLYIWDECAWGAHNNTGKSNWSQYAEHIQGHGALGSDYPKFAYGVEGDTPSFLYVMPTGLNDPNDPTQCSWGGTYKAESNNLWRDAGSCRSDFGRFYPAAFNNFAARMDWAKSGAGNRNPVIVLNGEKGAISVIKNDKPAGTSVTFDASATFDPDGDKLTFKWWTQFGNLEISGGSTPIATVKVPSGSAHLILEVTDNGVHNLSAYRRIVF
jgi:hypothetical protein